MKILEILIVTVILAGNSTAFAKKKNPNETISCELNNCLAIAGGYSTQTTRKRITGTNLDCQGIGAARTEEICRQEAEKYPNNPKGAQVCVDGRSRDGKLRAIMFRAEKIECVSRIISDKTY